MRLCIKDFDAYLLSPDKEKFWPRRLRSMKEAQRVGIFPKWYRAVDDKDNRISATKSIVDIVRNSLRDPRPLLFLEDDIDAWNPQCCFDVPDDADVFRLGNSTYFVDKDRKVEKLPKNAYMRPVSDDIIEVKGMLATHASVFLTPKAKLAFLKNSLDVVRGLEREYDIQLGVDSFDDLKTYSLIWPVFFQNEEFGKYTYPDTKVSYMNGTLVFNQIPPHLMFRDVSYNQCRKPQSQQDPIQTFVESKRASRLEHHRRTITDSMDQLPTATRAVASALLEFLP